MVFQEVLEFRQVIDRLLSDDERFALLNVLMLNPELGVLIPRGGGARKLRFAFSGQGKRGGLRIIYVWSKNRSQVLFLYVYKKTEKSDLTPQQITVLSKGVKAWL